MSNDYLGFYLVTNAQSICRVCLEKSVKLTPIFDPVKPPHFSVLMMACANVQVLNGDGLPQHICQKCITKLNLALQFKTQCESSDAKLRQSFENFANLPTNTEELSDRYEVSVNTKEGKNDSQQKPAPHNNDEVFEKLNEDLNKNPGTHTDYNNVERQENEVFHSNFTDDDLLVTSNILIDIKHINFKEEFIDPDKTKRENLDELEREQDIKLSNRPAKYNKIIKIHQCETCGKIFKNRPGLVHHIRTHTGERPYGCHICDKRFTNGGHLHTHMKVHTGEKNHICVPCNRGFTTAQQLTKHTIAIHTSERPYECSYCSKRFASSSNLSTHLKIHTGEKNFHCEICGKKFYTKGQLLQHITTHTGEKAFLCEFCHKKFSQKGHLIRHLKTHKSS